MIRTLYSISAALAFASNAFLISLVVFPDPAPVVGHQLWPKPAHECRGHRTIELDKEFRFKFPESQQVIHPRLIQGAERYRQRIRESLFQSPVPLGEDLIQKEDRSQTQQVKLSAISVEVEESSATKPLDQDTDESYQLSIGMDVDSETPFELDPKICQKLASAGPYSPGDITGVLRAKSIYGALRGMETFSQLVSNNIDPHDKDRAPTKEILSTPILIHDRPLFQHRGIMLDTSRNYLSMASLYRTIDAMAMNKFNVFHWHIIDAQSFNVELDDAQPSKSVDFTLQSQQGQGASSNIQQKSLPLSQLATKGSYGSAMTYTKQHIADLVDYAMDRGIRVIPEIDMPGHAWAWSKAFPEITTCLDGFPSYSRFSAEPPSGQLNPVMSKTYDVIQGVYDQILPLFKDKLVHAGADEVNFNCWNRTESVLELMEKKSIPRTKEGFDRILDGFVEKQHSMIRNTGKTPIVWEEPLLDHDLSTLKDNKDTVIQVWTSSQNIKRAVRKGHKVITGSADFWYLDCGYGDWLGNWTMGRSWCDPYKTWQRIYSFNPVQGLKERDRSSVLGGEALLWGEQVDDTNLDVKLWPRGSAVAEVLWSGNSEDSPTKLWNGPDQEADTLRSVQALDRLNAQRFRMVANNIGAEPLQPLWCVQHPGHCNWPVYDSKPKAESY